MQYAGFLSDRGLIGEAVAYAATAAALAARGRSDRRAPPLTYNADYVHVLATEAQTRLAAHAAAVGAPEAAQGTSILRKVGSFLDSSVMKLLAGDVPAAAAAGVPRTGSQASLAGSAKGGAAAGRPPRGVLSRCPAVAPALALWMPRLSSQTALL